MRSPFVALLLASCIAITAAPSSLPSNTKGACVLVRAETASNNPHSPVGTATGTGFFIERDLILTCDHLTKIPMGNQLVEAKSVSIEVKSGKFIPAKVVRRDLRHDLALLKISRPVNDVTPFKLAEFSVARGESVTIVGNFPEAMRVTSGHLLTHSIMEGFAMSSAKVRSGFSGGPIICGDGSIQGILSQRDDDNNSIFVRSDVVLELLKSYEKRAGRTLSCIPRAGKVAVVQALAEAAKQSAEDAVQANESPDNTNTSVNRGTSEIEKKSNSTTGHKNTATAYEPESEGVVNKAETVGDSANRSINHNEAPVIVAVPVRRAAVYTNNNLTATKPKN